MSRPCGTLFKIIVAKTNFHADPHCDCDSRVRTEVGAKLKGHLSACGAGLAPGIGHCGNEIASQLVSSDDRPLSEY